jgi:hypothetical protein
MAKCANCNSTILFGGQRRGDLRFCNDECAQGGVLISLSHQVPDNLVQQEVWAVHQGRCPQCQGPGPIDVHVSHEIWSAIVFTQFKSLPHVLCRSCGRKKQLGAMVFSFFAGWWGFPWGLIMTPVQIARNLSGMLRSPDPTRPSAKLEEMVRMRLAADAVMEQEPDLGD